MKRVCLYSMHLVYVCYVSARWLWFLVAALAGMRSRQVWLIECQVNLKKRL